MNGRLCDEYLPGREGSSRRPRSRSTGGVLTWPKTHFTGDFTKRAEPNVSGCSEGVAT